MMDDTDLQTIYSDNSIVESESRRKSVQIDDTFRIFDEDTISDDFQDEEEKDEVVSSEELLRKKSFASENIPVRDLKFDFPKLTPLSELETASIYCVIQEALDYFEILKSTLPGNKNLRLTADYQTIDAKYGTDEEPKFIHREEMGLPPTVKTYPEKLIRDTNFLIDILKKTVVEVLRHGQFTFLENVVNQTAQMRADEKQLEENYKMWLEISEETKGLIESNKTTNKEQLDELIKEIHESKSKINSIKFENVTKLEYVKRWEANRLEQQSMFAKQKEDEIKAKIKSFIDEEKNEQIIYTKLSSYLKNYIKQVETQIPVWNKKYNDEFETLQQEIVYLQEDIDDQKTEIEELIALKAKRQEFIDECYARKEEIRIKTEERMSLNKFAAIIQAFWRGYMVRHRLGPYAKLWKNLLAKKKQKSKKKKGLKSKKK